MAISKKAQRIHMLTQIYNSIKDIEGNSKHQTPVSVAKNMSVLAESIKDVLKIDGVGMIGLNEKAGG